MKMRLSYVSNSSTASYIIFNWFDLTEEQRNFIKNYDENALKLWNELNIKYHKINNEYCFDEDDNYSEKQTDKFYELVEKYGFGYLFNECKWHFDESKKRNACIVYTEMDNFDMSKWLKYNEVDFIEGSEFYKKGD